MGGPIAADTPDYQRGVVNAQKLLAAPSATSSVIVSPPPNTESMILIADQPSSPSDVVWCLGQTSLAYAPVYRLPASNGVNFNGAWIFDVSSVIDSSYRVYYGNGSHTQWYVYADAAARLVVDGSKLTDLHGQQYVIPSVPSALAGDHPPVELSKANGYSMVSGASLIAGPGAGLRIRVFAGMIAYDNTAGFASMGFGGANSDLCYAIHGTAAELDLPGQGFPCPVGYGISIYSSSGGYVFATIYYTVEAA